MPAMNATQHLAGVDWDAVDFLDLGCSKGGSLKFCSRRFDAKRGLGVDLSPRKVELALSQGQNAVLGDATSLGVEKRVRFVSMLNFLEHLPSLEVVEATIAQAARAATDFLFIRHPSFEGEGFAEILGVRQCWWHWRGHTAHIRVSDYCAMFHRLGLDRYKILYGEEVHDTGHESVIPVDAPVDSQQYDPAMMSAKPLVGFPQPLYMGQTIFVPLRDFEPQEWAQMTAKG